MEQFCDISQIGVTSDKRGPLGMQVMRCRFDRRITCTLARTREGSALFGIEVERLREQRNGASIRSAPIAAFKCTNRGGTHLSLLREVALRKPRADAELPQQVAKSRCVFPHDDLSYA
jgi:hypothetical protein